MTPAWLIEMCVEAVTAVPQYAFAEGIAGFQDEKTGQVEEKRGLEIHLNEDGKLGQDLGIFVYCEKEDSNTYCIWVDDELYEAEGTKEELLASLVRYLQKMLERDTPPPNSLPN